MLGLFFNMDAVQLQKIGLNNNEAKIYLVLLRLGSAQAGKISKATQINRTTIYDTLERLIEKGLVVFTISANRKVFKPISPNRLLNQIKEKEETFKEILPELNDLFRKSNEKEESSIYKGRKGIKSILNDILNYKEYFAFGSSGKFLEIMEHDFELFQRQKKKLRINAKIILTFSDRKTKQVKIAYGKFKFIPDKYDSPTTTFIYGNNVVIIIWGEVPIAVLIESKEVSKSYKNYFELLWKVAKS